MHCDIMLSFLGLLSVIAGMFPLVLVYLGVFKEDSSEIVLSLDLKASPFWFSFLLMFPTALIGTSVALMMIFLIDLRNTRRERQMKDLRRRAAPWVNIYCAACTGFMYVCRVWGLVSCWTRPIFELGFTD